ncbi:flagellar basal body-associated protein FliL [Bacillus sp. 03113]|uniref:flagellar basal body-associated protein FliL n=1 Tax=Bacillus sp. 03113 TaxID=2578211 RepID=UPI001142D394|nr:flagellar basal body-associated protein FliL [Bacillus sp. 03113]
MKNSSMLTKVLIWVMILVLLSAVGLFIYLKLMNTDKSNTPSIDEVLEESVDVPQITTNLASDDYIRISFKIQTDSKKAKTELEKRDFQVKNIIIQELSEKKPDDLKGKQGQVNLETELKNKINELMQDGKIEKVYVTESLLQ